MRVLVDDSRNQTHYKGERDYEVSVVEHYQSTRSPDSKTERTTRIGPKRIRTVDKSLRFDWAMSIFHLRCAVKTSKS